MMCWTSQAAWDKPDSDPAYKSSDRPWSYSWFKEMRSKPKLSTFSNYFSDSGTWVSVMTYRRFFYVAPKMWIINENVEMQMSSFAV